jgi:hypothetical protein
MTRIKYSLLLLICLLIPGWLYAQQTLEDEIAPSQEASVTEESSSSFRDPFDSALPGKRIDMTKPPPQEESDIIAPPQVTIEGVLWGSDKPQAIIDGEVYKEGDTLKTVDAQLFKIEKNVIYVRFKGKVFEFSPDKDKGARVKAQ